MTTYKYNKETGKVEEWDPQTREVQHDGFYIMPEFKPYRAVGIDNSIVESRSQHKQLLKQHGMEELGNDAPAWMKEQKYQEKYKDKNEGRG